MTPATAADAADVIALWDACDLLRPWNDPQVDFARAVASPQSAVLIARDGHTVAASVMVGDDGHRGWVYYVAVRPERRLAGLGRAAMAAAEGWLRDRGCPKFQLMVREGNHAAMAFYAAIGFERQAVVTVGKFL